MVSGSRQLPPYYSNCQGQSALWCSVCSNLVCLGGTDCSSQDSLSCSLCSIGSCLIPSPTPTLTSTPSSTPTVTPTPTVTRTPTPTPTVTITPSVTLTPTPTNYKIYGWVYKETNNDSSDRTSPPSEGLISGNLVDLSDQSGNPLSQTSSQGTAISGLLGNYQFYELGNSVYQVAVGATPTGSVLYSVPGQEHTNPQIAIINGESSIVDFPFVTIAPTVIPTATATTTPIPPTPSSQPTPTSLWSPTPSVGAGTPSLTPIPCQTLPTPALSAPAHELCTSSKPAFVAYVKNPNNDNAWAKFYSNSFEKFEAAGSTQPSSGGDSSWSPYESALISTGSYWWTAYTESSSCPRSDDAPALLVNMDNTAPPKPVAPTCALVSQDLISGLCHFNCTWPADPEIAGASCADTDDYHPVYTNSPGPGSWDPGWIGNQLSQDIYNVPDGQILIAKVQARDSVDNESLYSDDAIPAVCPKIIFAPTVTPGGPTVTITPNPTETLTPTPLVSPTPGDWVKIYGGDVYQSAVNQPALPTGNYYLDDLVLNPNSVGVIITNSGVSGLDVRSSPKRWESAGNISNAYSFSYYWEALKDKAKSITKSVGNNTVGTPADLNVDNNVYTYTQWGHYILDSTFNGRVAGSADTTIFLISGSLEVSSNFTLADFTDTVIFVVNGNIYIGGSVTNIPGLYISSQTFTVAAGSERIILEGMIYAKNLSLHRTYRDLNNPTYQIVYQPKYVVALLPYFGRVKVNWQEVTP